MVLFPSFLFLFCSHTVKFSTELIPVMKDTHIEYINDKGKTIIKGDFIKGSLFREGLALVQSDNEKGTWGFIDTKGKYVIPSAYVNATVFSEGIAWVTKKNSRPIAIDKTGKELFTLDHAELVGNYTDGLAKFAVYTIDGDLRWGFVDKKGTIVIKPIYKDVKSFSEGLAPVKLPQKGWGYIDKNGNFEIAPQYYMAKIFRNGKAVVYDKIDSATIVNKQNKKLLPDTYNDLHVDGDLYMFEKDRKFGWLNKEGKVAILPIYEEIHPFAGSNLALVRSDNMFGFIAKDGTVVIEPQYTEGFMFLDDIAAVTKDGQTGFINKKGDYVIQPSSIHIPFDIATQTYLMDTYYRFIFNEYIDTDVVFDKLDFIHTEGITSEMTYEEIFNLFDKEPSDFYNTSNQKIINRKVVNIDISYSFYTIGNPFFSEGNFTDSFDVNSKPKSFKYNIYLSDNMYKRIDKLQEKLVSKLDGFTKVDANTYQNKQMKLHISQQLNQLIIEITYL
jgi:hypothetical protein